MTYPALEDLEDEFLNRVCMDALGDGIQYKVVGGSYVAKKVYGDFAEALRDISTGQVISQDITCQMLVEDLPRRPIDGDRLTINRIAGVTYKPVNVRRSQDGKHWEFEVVKVNV
jgi:hypothetical protein